MESGINTSNKNIFKWNATQSLCHIMNRFQYTVFANDDMHFSIACIFINIARINLVTLFDLRYGRVQ